MMSHKCSAKSHYWTEPSNAWNPPAAATWGTMSCFNMPDPSQGTPCHSTRWLWSLQMPSLYYLESVSLQIPFTGTLLSDVTLWQAHKPSFSSQCQPCRISWNTTPRREHDSPDRRIRAYRTVEKHLPGSKQGRDRDWYLANSESSCKSKQIQQ